MGLTRSEKLNAHTELALIESLKLRTTDLSVEEISRDQRRGSMT